MPRRRTHCWKRLRQRTTTGAASGLSFRQQFVVISANDALQLILVEGMEVSDTAKVQLQMHFLRGQGAFWYWDLFLVVNLPSDCRNEGSNDIATLHT